MVRHLRASAVYDRAENVGVYYAHHAEVSLEALAGASQSRGKTLYLPVIDQPQKGFLSFGAWEADTKLLPNRWGIPEPPEPWVSMNSLQIVMMPLVAFDLSGNRVGMGGGYYDRTLAGLGHSGDAGSGLTLVGVAYECQQVDYFEPDPWDVPLDWILTENGIRACRAPS